MSWSLLRNSLLVSGFTTLLAVSCGFLAALWLASLPTRWRQGLLAAAIVAFALPPFLVTNCWIHLLGETGVWRSWLPLNIYSLGGTVWILGLMSWPITLVVVLSAWRRLEAAQLESDPALNGTALLRWALWPMGRVALGQAAVLTFVLALNNFAVPAILQVKIFPAELWVKFNTNFDYAAALALSWPLVLAPMLLIFCLRHAEPGWPRRQGPASSRALRRQLGPIWFWSAGLMTVLLLALEVGLPLYQLAATGRTWTELPNVWRASSGVVGNSFWLAAMAASLSVSLGLATWRWAIGRYLWLPLLVPGVLLGVALIFVFNRPVFGVIYQSVAIVVVAWTVRYVAPAWNAAAQALRSVDRDLTDAARLEGASGWALLRHVFWPQIAPQVGAGWYVTYLLCLWDVETLVLIVPPGGETLAVRVFNLLHYGHNAQVNALCLMLLALAAAPLAIWSFWRGLRANTAS